MFTQILSSLGPTDGDYLFSKDGFWARRISDSQFQVGISYEKGKRYAVMTNGRYTFTPQWRPEQEISEVTSPLSLETHKIKFVFEPSFGQEIKIRYYSTTGNLVAVNTELTRSKDEYGPPTYADSVDFEFSRLAWKSSDSLASLKTPGYGKLMNWTRPLISHIALTTSTVVSKIILC